MRRSETSGYEQGLRHGRLAAYRFGTFICLYFAAVSAFAITPAAPESSLAYTGVAVLVVFGGYLLLGWIERGLGYGEWFRLVSAGTLAFCVAAMQEMSEYVYSDMKPLSMVFYGIAQSVLMWVCLLGLLVGFACWVCVRGHDDDRVFDVRRRGAAMSRYCFPVPRRSRFSGECLI